MSDTQRRDPETWAILDADEAEALYEALRPGGRNTIDSFDHPTYDSAMAKLKAARDTREALDYARDRVD